MWCVRQVPKTPPLPRLPTNVNPTALCVCLVLITEVFHRWVKCKLQRVQHDKWSTKKNNNFSSVCVCQDSFSTTERGSSFRSLLGGGGAIVFRPNVTRHTQPQRDHKYVLCLCLSNVWVIAERFIAASQLENNYMFTSFIIYRLILCRVADMLNRSQHG